MISKVEQESLNCDKKLFNIKSEKSRLGSVDFLVPLLKKCSDRVVNSTQISAIGCVKQLKVKLPINSIIVFEDIHLGTIYTERNINYLLQSRPDILVITTSKYEMKSYSGASEVAWLLEFDFLDQENDFLLNLLTTEEKVVILCILALSDEPFKKKANFGNNANPKNLFVKIETLSQALNYFKLKFKEDNISTHKFGEPTTIPVYYNKFTKNMIKLENMVDNYLLRTVEPFFFSNIDNNLDKN